MHLFAILEPEERGIASDLVPGAELMMLRAVNLQGKTTVQSAPGSLPGKNVYGTQEFH